MVENETVVPDSLRLDVVNVPADSGGGFLVRVFVNEVEMTSAGAGLGMDPYDILIPENRLEATSEPRRVPIARCECGRVRLWRHGCHHRPRRWRGAVGLVGGGPDEPERHLRHRRIRPRGGAGRGGLVVGALGPDPGRLVLTHVDRDRLRESGLEVSWVGLYHRAPEHFRVALQLAEDYQIFVDTPGFEKAPDKLAREVCATLARPPGEWDATWHAIKFDLVCPPTIAPPSWQREQVP